MKESLMELLGLGGLLGAVAGGWIGWASSAEDRSILDEIDLPSAGVKSLVGESERHKLRRLLRTALYAVFGSIVVYVLVKFVVAR